MATITNAKLNISHDHQKRTARPVVTCDVNFTPLELCLMRSCEKTRMFKLKCELWGEDGGLTGSDDYVWTYGVAYYFPDPSPSSSEHREFEVTVGEGVLDEDWGEDEIYGKLVLYNLFTTTKLQKKTNTVSHSF